MRRCSYPPRARASADAIARRRFIAALFVSVLVHAGLTSGIAPGSSGRSKPGPVAPPLQIAVRLVVPVVELPVTAPAPEAVSLPEPAPPRRAREEVIARPADALPTPPSSPAGAAPAAIPDPTYYAARQLDVYPALTGTLDVRYPGAVDAKGRVLLLVLIDAAGQVDDVNVVESEAPGYLDDDARRALMAARFKPALRGGVPVKSRLLVEIDYAVQERTP